MSVYLIALVFVFLNYGIRGIQFGVRGAVVDVEGLNRKEQLCLPVDIFSLIIPSLNSRRLTTTSGPSCVTCVKIIFRYFFLYVIVVMALWPSSVLELTLSFNLKIISWLKKVDSSRSFHILVFSSLATWSVGLAKFWALRKINPTPSALRYSSTPKLSEKSYFPIKWSILTGSQTSINFEEDSERLPGYVQIIKIVCSGNGSGKITVFMEMIEGLITFCSSHQSSFYHFYSCFSCIE